MVTADFSFGVHKLGNDLEAGRACEVAAEVTLYLDIKWLFAAVGSGILIGLYNR